MSNNIRSKGFTLIELMLAMTFISFLLLFMVSAILQVTKLYVKGTAIRQINQTGRQLMDEVGSTLRNNARPVYIAANNRLCAGNTSYLWNSDGEAINVFTSPNAAVALRFISVQDPSGTLCNPPYGAISKTGTTDLVGADITPLDFSVEQQGRLWSVSLMLSTTESNKAIDVSGGGAPKFECAPDNQFCAFGNFETSVYSRGGE